MSAFDNVIGYEKEKEQLYRLCDMAKDPAKYAALGVRLPRGVLLHGDPGVGKTLMATALIEAMGRKSYTVRKDKANEQFVETIREVFAEAKESAPSVIFLDDLDKFPSDSDSRNPEELIAVQTGIDEVKEADVFVVATANEIRELPRPLRRPGRFDIILEICPPNRKEAVEIVRHYLADKKVAADVSAESVARLMDGNSCAALEAVLNEAGIYAGYENCREIGREHIVRAVLRTVFEAEESVNGIPLSEKEEVAFHEAGHAAAALAFDPEGVGLVSVRPSKSDARGVTQVFKAENYFGSYDRMRERVIMLLAGKAAVELQFGRLDVGSGSDIDRASAIVQRFITDYAASGFALFHPDNHFSLSSELHDDKIVTERGAMLARFYEEAKEVLRKNWTFVEKLAAALVEKDTLIYEEIVQLREACMAGFGTTVSVKQAQNGATYADKKVS